ncbi:ferrochelatase [Rubrivirga sp. S365]|uniref:ferrochelatase n=1 Tax=Rubrivirga sp. S365 TaxID=3076080 RepID=UPI0028C8EE30|nr:ferrochelatase [Rubrivirga sp. S365]MDT7856671.1 ferrochelatase [Rubrivirga sp. S365]
MTPFEYLRRFRPDRATLTGEAFELGALAVEPGSTVGVVLMGLGGPSRPEEAVPFLYSRLMDPAEVELRVPQFARHRTARLLARRRGRRLAQAFELIGGASPLRRHAEEQARALQRVLSEGYDRSAGVDFRVYVAMRHGEPSMEAARAQMAEDAVTKVVLLPLQPHFSAATTGSSLAYWSALEDEPAADHWPTTLVRDYAGHPKLVHALSERIDEGLQRFPREVRDRVQILFAAHGAQRRHLTALDDPYCCQVQATVEAVLEARAEPERSVGVAFETPLGAGRPVGPTVDDALDDLASDGSSAVLVVPVSFISDRVETAFDLDVTARGRAAGRGVSHFEVTSGLNCHALLIDALAESVAGHVRPASDGPRAPVPPAPSRSTCAVCGRAVPAREWPDVAPHLTPRQRTAA